jgi:hypothetical protein
MLDYFSPSECHYSSDEIIWILNNCDLENCTWPSRESNYTDAPISRSVNPHMAGESAILVLAEIKVRLTSCGDAGKRLQDAFLATDHLYSLDDYGLSFEGRSVVSYVSGQCRKWQVCDDCINRLITNNEKKTSRFCSLMDRLPVTFIQWLSYKSKEKEEILKKPCECGANSWRTVRKNEAYKCRKCGKVRIMSELKGVLNGI